MLNQLLETIIQILTGWVNQFTSHAQHVEDKLDSLDQTASDIETNTEPISDIKDNTGAVITPIQNIKTNTDSIATSSQTSANNTTAILNNIGTLSTNTGRAAAYAQDCANNTLDIKDKVTTIASDTTQLRADSANIAADVSSINQAIGYYIANTIVTEDSEGDICNFDTDLSDYLQACKVTIPADLTGFTGITLTKCGKNLLNNASFKNYTDWKANLAPYGDFSTASSRKGYYLKTNPGDVITITFGFDDTDFPTFLYLCKADGVSTSSLVTYFTTGSFVKNTYTFTADNNMYYFRIGASDQASFITQMSKISFVQIEIGETQTTYEPYKAMTYPVSFGSTITDGAEVDLLEGLIKINSTPVSYQSITPIAVRTYKGVNNIYSDVGTSALTYRETLKHYLDKNNQ